jgi:hypothetical protein
MVDVRINGHGPYRLMVDSGAACLVLATDVAVEAGIKREPRSTGTVKGSVQEVGATLGMVEKLESGGLTLENIGAAIVGDADIAIARDAFGKFDGALGLAALRDVVLEMDFKAGKVSVAKPGTEAFPADSGLPYVQDGLRAIAVDIEVGKMTGPVLVDTGADEVLNLPNLEQFPLLYPKVREEGFGVFGVGSAAGWTFYSQLDGKARVGPATLENPPLTEGDARIGARAFDGCTLAIDQHARRLYILGDRRVLEWREEILDPRERSGLRFHLEDGGIRIAEVEDGTAGSLAGLHSGDLIVGIDGAKAPKGISQAHKLLLPGTHALQVERDGNALAFNLTWKHESWKDDVP